MATSLSFAAPGLYRRHKVLPRGLKRLHWKAKTQKRPDQIIPFSIPTMSSSTASEKKPPISLSPEAIDDLIYDARSGDLDALKSDIESLRTQHNNCSASEIVASAIDAEPESEGGSGACLLHFPAANGNIGPFQLKPWINQGSTLTLLC